MVSPDLSILPLSVSRFLSVQLTGIQHFQVWKAFPRFQSFNRFWAKSETPRSFLGFTYWIILKIQILQIVFMDKCHLNFMQNVRKVCCKFGCMNRYKVPNDVYWQKTAKYFSNCLKLKHPETSKKDYMNIVEICYIATI